MSPTTDEREGCHNTIGRVQDFYVAHNAGRVQPELFLLLITSLRATA